MSQINASIRNEDNPPSFVKMSLPYIVKEYHPLQHKGSRSHTDVIIPDNEKLRPKNQQEIPFSLNLKDMIDKIVQDKDLWDEFRHELQRRKVVTSLATKEVLVEFLRERMKDFEESTNSMDEHMNDYTINPLMHEFKDRDTQKMERKPFVDNLLNKNNLFQTTSKCGLPQFHFKDMALGITLGKGSQSMVYEIESFTSKTSYSPFKKEQVKESRRKHDQDRNRKFNFMCDNSQCKEQLPQHFAAKLPRRDSKKYQENIEDLLHESNILSSVDHPNVIKIHGMSSIEPSQPGSEQSLQPFFLILDRLSYNLDELLKVWASKENNMNVLKFQTFKEKTFQQRLKVAHDIAAAMKHLHEKNIMHRDLKPANIGFNSQGELKLFDFGYATKLQAKDRLPDGKYKLKGGIGTCRYMAPEVARYEPYDELADVYSFGVLVWEILTLEKPYKNIECKEWLNKVIFGGKRPDIDKSWPALLQNLLNCCWSDDINERPSFDIIIDVLDEM